MPAKESRPLDLHPRTGATTGLRGNGELLHAMGNELGVAMAVAERAAHDDAVPPAVREDMNTVVEAISRTEGLRGRIRFGSTNAQDTADLLACQTEVLELVARKAPLSATLAALATGMERHLPGTHCSILLFDPEESRLHHCAAPTLSASYTAEIDGMAIGPVAGSCGTAAYTRRPVFVSDILADERWAAFRAVGVRHGLRACWSYPVISPSSSDVLGTFAVYHRRPHRPGAEERLVVERFTHLAAVAIEHHQLFNALHESEERFRGAFTDAAVGMALVDRDGRLAHVNTALCTETGHDLDDLFGMAVDALFEPGSAAEVRDALSRIVSGRAGCYSRDHDFLHADGSRRAAYLLLSPVTDAEGRLRFVCLQLRDITDRLRIRGERQAREAAERANLVKSEFVAQLNHEMRTPLNAVVGFAELLRRSALAPEAAEHARHIVEAGAHLERLLEDTLCMARAEAGSLPMHFEPLDPAEIAREAISFTQPFAERMGIELRAPTGPAPRAVADRHRLRQVLLNLLTNAIKYNRPGGRVAVRSRKSADQVRITVEDTGRGIGPAALERIFTPFERPGAAPDDPAGVGLGLALTKKLVTAMGGSIAVDSEVGVGTRFRVDLPAHEAERPAGAEPVDPLDRGVQAPRGEDA
ncbi:ATP-binding protein [Saccharopolyspora rosea]|uniref:histidine kinase n=1 Tax=Saccharopolyspora rosea TaxID=524884 RepID=A0ABW3FM80_9PSEU|nr:ATP-binding protein [Saccharopolyspora rosea]